MYDVMMESLEARTACIGSAEKIGSTEPVQYQGAVRLLERVRVESKYLIYRLSNMRTSVKQAEYIAEHQVPATFFSDTDENISSQQAQHGILLELSKDAKADIYAQLRDHPLQDRPIVVTTSGSVVDGNRRLAAMRELYASDPTRYSSFRYVEAAVLPATATQDDLVELETVIQIQPDLKSDYGWIEEALGLERQLSVLRWDIDKVASLWKQSKKELNDRIAALDIARDFLDHIGKPGEFGEVEAAEQAVATFRDTTSTDAYAALAPRKKEANRLVMFSVLKSTDISRRKYDYAKNIDEITDRVIAQFDIPTSETPRTSGDGSSPFGELPADESDIDPAVLEVLTDLEILGEIAGYAEEALIDIDSQKRAFKKGNQLLQAATSAYTKLVEVQKPTIKHETYLPSTVKLLSVIAEATELIDFLVHEDPTLPGRLNLAQVNQLKPTTSLSRKLSDAVDS